MLLHTLRRSHTLARLVLVWFVLAMGVAIAAPTVQPVELGSICSASSTVQGQKQESPDRVAGHDALKCILCLGTGAPPLVGIAPLDSRFVAELLVPSAPDVVVLSARNSPLSARAPPAL